MLLQHMRTLAGPDACLAFTHLSRATSASLSAAFAPPSSASSPAPSPTQQAHAECHEQGVLALMQARGITREQVCLLDPKASEALAPSDGGPDAGKFTWFLFGVRLHFPFPCTCPSISFVFKKFTHHFLSERVYSVR